MAKSVLLVVLRLAYARFPPWCAASTPLQKLHYTTVLSTVKEPPNVPAPTATSMADLTYPSARGKLAGVKWELEMTFAGPLDAVVGVVRVVAVEATAAMRVCHALDSG